jgi:hypothetical protein
VKVSVRNVCTDFDSYRAARVKSLFNVESGANFSLDADLPIDDGDWKIGLIVGPSGSGKTSMGRRIFGPEAFYEPAAGPRTARSSTPSQPGGSFDAVTARSPPWAWAPCRPGCARTTSSRTASGSAPTSPASSAMPPSGSWSTSSRAWLTGRSPRSGRWRSRSPGAAPGQAVLLSCHYDIIDWLEPDWVFDTGTGTYSGRGLWRRPRIELEIWQTDWRYWPMFEPHHYLKAPAMIAARCYVGAVDGEPVCHLGMGSAKKGKSASRRAAAGWS